MSSDVGKRKADIATKLSMVKIRIFKQPCALEASYTIESNGLKARISSEGRVREVSGFLKNRA